MSLIIVCTLYTTRLLFYQNLFRPILHHDDVERNAIFCTRCVDILVTSHHRPRSRSYLILPMVFVFRRLHFLMVQVQYWKTSSSQDDEYCTNLYSVQQQFRYFSTSVLMTHPMLSACCERCDACEFFVRACR